MTRKTIVTSLGLALGCLALPGASVAADIRIPAKVHQIKQDKKAGYVGKQAKLVSKPLGGAFVLPTESPTAVGAALRFFLVGSDGPWAQIDLPAAQWSALGKPAGSKGYKYRGLPGDACRSVRVTPKSIKASCSGPGSSASPTTYVLPVGDLGAGFELAIGGDRYCAESSAATLAQVKKNDAAKGLYKAIRAQAPLVCPEPDPETNCDDTDVCTTDSFDGQQCQHEPVSCDDSDPCTVDACDSQAAGCSSVPKDCDDLDESTIDSCEPQTGECQHVPTACTQGPEFEEPACSPELPCCAGAACIFGNCFEGFECSAPGGACDEETFCCFDQPCVDGACQQE